MTARAYVEDEDIWRKRTGSAAKAQANSFKSVHGVEADANEETKEDEKILSGEEDNNSNSDVEINSTQSKLKSKPLSPYFTNKNLLKRKNFIGFPALINKEILAKNHSGKNSECSVVVACRNSDTLETDFKTVTMYREPCDKISGKDSMIYLYEVDSKLTQHETYTVYIPKIFS